MVQPTPVDTEIEALVRTGLYQNHDEVVSDALRNLLLNNKNLRLELAIELFKADEVSLGRAAEIAGTDRWEFQDILHQRRIPIIIEAESAEAMDRDIARFFGYVGLNEIIYAVQSQVSQHDDVIGLWQ